LTEYFRPVSNPVRVSVETLHPLGAWRSVIVFGTVPPSELAFHSNAANDTKVYGGIRKRSAYAKSKGIVPVHFTLDELKELKAGQVMIGKHQSKSAVVPEQEFQDAAKDSC
jgi:hypothetical protein